MCQVILCEYDPAWPDYFLSVSSQIRAVLGSTPAHIEHIGSTSVVGLCAKPTLDVLLGVAKLDDIETKIPALETCGYVYRPEYEAELPARRYFVRPQAEYPQGQLTRGQLTRVHLHAVIHESPIWRNHLAFRNALRADPELAQQYAQLKRTLAIQNAHDKAAYTHAKGPFIKSVLAKNEQHVERSAQSRSI